MTERDRLYRRDGSKVEPFEFNDSVVRVFPDMIERSVPGYRLLLELTPLIVARAVQPDSRIYDLGCSLGAATLAARRAVRVDGVEMLAIDSSCQMVRRCRQIVAAEPSTVPVRVIEGDITRVAIENASLVMVFFTLQFIAPAQRDGLLARISAGLRPGGVLLLAEKLAFDDSHVQHWMDQHHADFKRASGYSELEIARKRQALENVLIPETRAAHHARLRAAGFGQVIDWFSCLNFTCMAARREPAPVARFNRRNRTDPSELK